MIPAARKRQHMSSVPEFQVTSADVIVFLEPAIEIPGNRLCFMIVDFGSCRVRIVKPCARRTRP